MNKDELLEHVKDVTAFLKDLESALPGKVEADLVSFLESIGQHPWLGDLLVAHLLNSKSAKGFAAKEVRYK